MKYTTRWRGGAKSVTVEHVSDGVGLVSFWSLATSEINAIQYAIDNGASTITISGIGTLNIVSHAWPWQGGEPYKYSSSNVDNILIRVSVDPGTYILYNSTNNVFPGATFN